jgi:hypothetical protein
VEREKRRLDVEKLLQWAYRDELPKQTTGDLTGWERLILLGTNVDVSDREAALPIALGPPHPDALLIDHAVRQLPPVKLNWARMAKALMGHLLPYAPQTDPCIQRLATSPAALVVSHAIMGSRPPWDLGPCVLRRILGKNGKPVVDGITAGRRYGAGASCPLQLEPEGAEIISARFEYAAWHTALVSLANESWNMREHVALPPRAAPAPWITGPEPTSRILRTIERHELSTV